MYSFGIRKGCKVHESFVLSMIRFFNFQNYDLNSLAFAREGNTFSNLDLLLLREVLHNKRWLEDGLCYPTVIACVISFC